MAEVVTQEKQGHRRTRQKSIRVDMTPMVDLGFLLITFFMFTTNFSKLNKMDVKLPAQPTDKTITEINEKNQVTFILGKNNRIFYHQSSEGKLSTHNLKEAQLNDENIKSIIEKAYQNAPSKENFTIIIKPTDEANYKNFVDVFDNVAASKESRYGISELRPWEKQVYNQLIK